MSLPVAPARRAKGAAPPAVISRILSNLSKFIEKGEEGLKILKYTKARNLIHPRPFPEFAPIKKFIVVPLVVANFHLNRGIYRRFEQFVHVFKKTLKRSRTSS